MDAYLQIVGLAGAPLVRSAIKATKVQNGLVIVLLSLIFGILLNVALALVLNTDLRIGLALGIVTGFASNIYNDIKAE